MVKPIRIDSYSLAIFNTVTTMADPDLQDKTIIARFYTTDGEATGPQLAIPLDITIDQLHTLLNQHVLKNDEELPYSFFVHEEEIVANLYKTLQALGKQEDEEVLKVVYQPQAIFRVRAVTRCTSSLPGHTEAILSVNFSPDGSKLASGSGDTTIRLWDTDTETPYKECKGHTNWVLCVKWAPNGSRLASGGMDRTICLWDSETGELDGTLRGHKNYITSVDWEPVHRNPNCVRLVSSSKDGTAKVWDVTTKKCLFTMGGHSASITQVKWGGEGLIYTASQDRSIKVWSDKDGKLVRSLTGHGHWVNTLSLNTDYVLRTGAYDHTGKRYEDPAEAQKRAHERWEQVKGKGPEKLISGSDDFTMYLWEPAEKKQPLLRLTGHGKPINVAQFSPDGNLIASASFDKNLKLWNSSGKYLGTFRGHIGEVYQVTWSSDSRLIASGSKDSTLKVWSVKEQKVINQLPGHADEIYTVDWSPDGQRVASGSKDRILKIWRH